MPKYVVSANYLDRDSDFKWLVRREDEAIDKAVAHKSVLCRGVKFQDSNESEEGFGCWLVAIVDQVKLDLESLPGGEPLRFARTEFVDQKGAAVYAVDGLALTPSGAVLALSAAQLAVPETRKSSANTNVLSSMQVIRDAAMVAQDAPMAPLVAAAVEVANAYEESLSQSAIVSISAGPAISADEIAEKVVERLTVVGAAMVKRPMPDGVPPVPWQMAEFGLVLDATGASVLSENDIGINLSPVVRHNAACSIVEAVNAYFGGGPQPPTPAQASAANSETQLPDTAGYPVPDYDAVEIPPAGEAAEPLCPVKQFVAAIEAALLRMETEPQASKMFQHAIAAAVSIAGAAEDITEAEAKTAWLRARDAVLEVVDSVVAARPGPQSAA